MKKKRESRRAFLKTGTVALGGLALGAAVPAVAEAASPKVKWDETFDVVVVGSGLSAVVAALAAKVNGCRRVVMIEKMDVLGGASAIAAGDMAAVGSALARKHGIQDSPEALAADIAKLGGGYHHPELTLTLARNCGRAMDFMVEHGARFYDKLIQQGGHSARRVHQPVEGCSRGALQPLYKDFVENQGGEIRTRVKFDRFIQDKDGRVVGVAVRERYAFDPDSPNDDQENRSGIVRHYRAARAVIMGSGGYGRDIEFRRQDTPILLPEMLSTAGLGATSGAFRALLGIGARPVNMAFARFGFHLSATDLRFSCIVHPVSGERCLNEGMPRPAMTNKVVELHKAGANRFPIAIFDREGVGSFDDPLRTQRQYKLGYLRDYPTVEALCAGEKLPVEGVRKALARYNELMRAGRDDDFGKDPKSVKNLPIRQAPFYASTVLPLSNRGMGGVLITPRAEVISLTNQVIPGLYAAGEAASGVHGSMSLISTTLPAAFTFGLIAGEQAAGVNRVL